MGLSTNTHVYTGGDRVFPVSFALGFLNKEDVTVYVEGELDGLGDIIYRQFTWNSDNEIVVIDPITADASNPKNVVIQRTVSKSELVVDFIQEGTATRQNIQYALSQAMMAIHEFIDGRIEPLETVYPFSAYIELIKDYMEQANITYDQVSTQWEEHSEAIIAAIRSNRVFSDANQQNVDVAASVLNNGDVFWMDGLQYKLDSTATDDNGAPFNGAVPYGMILYPKHFQIVGAKSVGNIDIVGTDDIPDETTKIQNLFQYAIDTGMKIVFYETDRDYKITDTITLYPALARNKGNTNATVAGGALLALHHSNTPSLWVENPGNSRIIADGAMEAMFDVRNPNGINSTPPYWMQWGGVNAHTKLTGNRAETFIKTDWSYRNKYFNCKVFGFDYGWWCRHDAGSHWGYNEVNCKEAAAYFDSAGDLTYEGGDISVQKHGLLFGGGNNSRVRGVTFTGNGTETEIRAISLKAGSTIDNNPRSRSIHISDCEFAGVDWCIHGADTDGDIDEIWNVTATNNHYVRNILRPEIQFARIENGNMLVFSGNNHGDLVNVAANLPAYELVSCDGFVIQGDTFAKFNGEVISLIGGCRAGTISSTFINCALTDDVGIINIVDSSNNNISGSAVHWVNGNSPNTGAYFVKEGGTSFGNRASHNSVDSGRMRRPYHRIAQTTVMQNILSAQQVFDPASVSAGANIVRSVLVPGARRGDIVQVGFTADLLDITVTGQVDSDDVVQVIFSNTHPNGSVDIASGTLNIIVLTM